MTSEQLAWLIRRHGVEMTHLSGGSHIASILSVADIIAVLYSDVLRYDPQDPKMPERDYQNGSILSGHVSHKGVPGVEFSTGSLGHGLPVAAGMAQAAKMDDREHRVYVVLGDGECDEGSVWEAALFANHFGLNNLVAIIDHNKMQSLDFCENTLKLSPFAEKWRSFGWNALQVDGHDHNALRTAFDEAKRSEKPTVIIADTVKGKGISFMEFDILWHYRFPHDGWEYDDALKELHAAMPAGITDPYGKEDAQ